MNGPVAGLQPWLPPPLSRWSWWTAPVAAERLAALRIGVALVLLVDVFGTYWARAGDFFGAGSLTAGTFTPVAPLEWHRALLYGIDSPACWQGLLLLWAGAAVLLLLGLAPRGAAAVAWLLSISVMRQNPSLHNSGDQVRNIVLFYLMLCPSGAVWSVPAWWRRRAGRTGPRLVYPWVLRLLFVQLAAIYFMNGLFKLCGEQWQSGTALACVLGDAGWTRWSFAGWPRPPLLLQAMSFLVLAWELTFPLTVGIAWLRTPVLLMGVLFHVGTGVTLQIGPFPLYMLCLYLPLVPWNKWHRHDLPEMRDCQTARRTIAASTGEHLSLQ